MVRRFERGDEELIPTHPPYAMAADHPPSDHVLLCAAEDLQDPCVAAREDGDPVPVPGVDDVQLKPSSAMAGWTCADEAPP